MASRIASLNTVRQVKPMLSLDNAEARSRVINLYKAWYRQIPQIAIDYELPKSQADCRKKLKEMFLKNKDVKDIRMVDMLVIKGQMELQETVNIWKQKNHLMMYWYTSADPKPKDFMGKFLDGHN